MGRLGEPSLAKKLGLHRRGGPFQSANGEPVDDGSRIETNPIKLGRFLASGFLGVVSGANSHLLAKGLTEVAHAVVSDLKGGLGDVA